MTKVSIDKEELQKDIYEEIVRVAPMWLCRMSLLFGILSVSTLLFLDGITLFSPLAIVCSVYAFDAKSKSDRVYAGIGFLLSLISYLVILAF
jgi:hypothetical protein